jgi:hypothetical protein
MWEHPTNIKRPEFGIFSLLYPDCSRLKRNFMAVID